MAKRIKMVFDMETGDPDDAMALCILATHPRVDLRAITVFPGGHDQVGLAKHVLALLGRPDVLVGAGTPKKEAPRVAGFYRDWLGGFGPCIPDGTAVEVIHGALDGGATHLVTGAALTNVHEALQARGAKPFFQNWTCQGGFAGDNVVPPEFRLPKFEGRITCPTFNLNGDVPAAKALISTEAIPTKRFVTKNVCHGIIYDQSVQLPDGAHPGLDLLKLGMLTYFQKHPNGKALHDVIAVALAINPSAATWVRGFPYREKGEWGTRPDTDFTFVGEPGPYPVTIALDVEKFYQTLEG